MKRVLAFILCLSLTAWGTTYTYDAGSLATSLSAVAATGAGDVFITPVINGKIASEYTWQVIYTGTPTAITVNLQGSIDGTNYFTLDSTTATASEMRHVTNKSARFVRCQISAYTVNGSTTTCAFVMNLK